MDTVLHWLTHIVVIALVLSLISFVARRFRMREGVAAALVVGVPALLLAIFVGGSIALSTWYEPERVVDRMIANDPMLAAVEAAYPETGQAVRADALRLRIEDREALNYPFEARKAALYTRMAPAMSTENTWRLIQLLRDQGALTQPYPRGACAEILSGKGLYAYPPQMLTLDRYQEREDRLLIDLVRQTTEAPATPVRPLSTAERAALHAAAMVRLSPKLQAAAREALRHPGEVTTEPYADGYCRYRLAQLDALLAMQPAEAARVYKGVRAFEAASARRARAG